MGAGKSSLSCILSLRDDQKTIPLKQEEQLFKSGPGEAACTTEVQVELTPGSQVSGYKRLRIIDSPGMDQDDDEDVDHLREMFEKIKKETRFIKLFPIVINSQTRAEQQCTMETIAIFQEIFGAHFWPNACVVVTHFSQSAE